MKRILVPALAALMLAGPAAAQSQDVSFDTWRDGFRGELLESGARPETVALMLDDLSADLRVIDRDGNQPEFVRPIWSYLGIAASDLRIQNGRSAYAEHGETINAVAERFGVRPETLVAIWGLESSFGAITGNFDTVRSLATLAWDGRRRSWAEAQLIAIAEMIDEGYATREQLTGSWAGAMGQMQFIPTTYLERAHDWDGDGTRNIWTDIGDAVASAANLLAEEGWQSGAPTVVEVSLSEDFDLTDWNPTTSRLVSQWAVLGITPAAGEWQADDLMRSARLELPAGRNGPGFLTFPNFRVIKRYNNSTAYALGVAHLADRIAGGAAFVGDWPEGDVPLTRSQTREVQAALNAAGHNAGTPDGIAGPNTRRALRAFQRANGMAPDGYLGSAMYEAVTGRPLGD
ncbi:lytic murein transglycosylase [Maricaulis sp.]|uniref:lytic murein transglycosylase n=1 Tax=Maricaulis sp. TaxID=1486257 RepID=UPI002639691E|nr:lytic murein transglycosylase [Maricaulis sp.]